VAEGRQGQVFPQALLPGRPLSACPGVKAKILAQNALAFYGIKTSG